MVCLEMRKPIKLRREVSYGAKLLRDLRISMNLSRNELAEILNVDPTQISQLECDYRRISELMARRLSEFFKLDFRQFLIK